jgi:hypothetical protein
VAFKGLGKTEITESDGAVLGEENVRRLDITVDAGASVKMGDGAGTLFQDGK